LSVWPYPNQVGIERHQVEIIAIRFSMLNVALGCRIFQPSVRIEL
jgi:hypothetical protein